jgi:acetylornithine deacetylase/succinyl-diaminopimelate desuccinylase-like protein
MHFTVKDKGHYDASIEPRPTLPLGGDSVNTGFSLLDDGAHSPDEKLHLPTFYRGIDALIRFFFNLGSK